MKIKFTKMHGLGNDFVVIDAINQPYQPNSQSIRQWGDRRTGIGFDQLLLVEKARDNRSDFFYRIFNADGTEVAQCGNGAYCLAKFLRDENLIGHENLIRIATQRSLLTITLESNERVTVDMGVPSLEPKAIPFLAETSAVRYALTVGQQSIDVCALSLGNPHCVLKVDELDVAPVQTWGKQISEHDRFPERTNVEFMQIVDKKTIRLRTYERGVGETQACGSGACAAVIAGRLLHCVDEQVRVQQPGGELTVAWKGNHASVFLTGTPLTVFKGEIGV